jgi:LacI family transcriptional regulator
LQPKTKRRGGNTPTLGDVARAAAVSPMTVSRVINTPDSVRPETRDRVLAAIGSLNYSPNSAARTLAGATQTRIVLLYGNPSAAYLGEVLVGCLSEATRSDIQLLLEKSESMSDAVKTAKRLAKDGVDGVILPSPFCDVPEIRSVLLKAGIPTAVLAGGVPASGTFEVMIDDERAALDMTCHLLGLGHRRIGFIIGDPEHAATAARLNGYRTAMHRVGLDVPPDLVAQGDFSYRSGLAAADVLLNGAPTLTAIFASNDDMAAAAVAAAHRRHIRVPEDLSICGFDDTPLATTISPELTTVRQPVADMAQAAVEMLTTAARVRRQGGVVQPEQRLFAHSIVKRRSDAAPNPAIRRLTA